MVDVSQVGVCLRAEYADGYSLDRVPELARLADDLGYHSVWLAESWGHEALVLASHIATVTEQIKVGTAIVNVYSRTPPLLAMAAATLVELFPGRLILGLGASTRDLVEGFHGLSFDQPVQRMKETFAYLRQAFSGDEITLEGDVFQFSGYRLRNAPKADMPPLFGAGLGPKSLEMIGQTADGWIPYLLPLGGLGGAIDKVRSAATAAGRRPEEVQIVALIVATISDEESAARTIARDHLAYYLGAMGPHYRGFVARHGFEGLPERIAEEWADGNRDGARELVSAKMVDQLSVAGNGQSVATQLAEYRNKGVDVPVLFFPKGCSSEMVVSGLRALAETT